MKQIFDTVPIKKTGGSPIRSRGAPYASFPRINPAYTARCLPQKRSPGNGDL